MPKLQAISFFISAHGYGHASRSAAVMAELVAIAPELEINIFTTVPESLFRQSLPMPFHYLAMETDVGFVQLNALSEDLQATLARLDQFYPIAKERIEKVSSISSVRKSQLIVSDISPLGIVVAEALGIPSLLIENFTWDWLYEELIEESPRLGVHSVYLRDIFAEATYHVQADPVCELKPHAIVVSPVSRKPRTPREQIRRELSVPEESSVLLLTMGGTSTCYNLPAALRENSALTVIIPGGGKHEVREDNIILLPKHSQFFHPDLIDAADAVIGKLGYSTLAEIYYAGCPYGYILRERSREARVLAQFVKQQMIGIPLTASEFEAGSWLEIIPDLFQLPRRKRESKNGAHMIAQFIREVIS